jgi:branched-chain amino acid transport system substrate-binding protein
MKSSLTEQRKPNAVFRPMPQSDDSIVIGLDADMTSASAKSGEAIRRGIFLAIQEINQAGGVLGQELELIVRDHRGNPVRGIDNIEELAGIEQVVTIVGGIHTPVALEELVTIHDCGIPYLSPWAAGTPLVTNGYSPNFVFRVSVRDEYAGEFLVDATVRSGKKHLALLLERTGWGRSNQTAMVNAMKTRGLTPSTIQWFNWGEISLQEQVDEVVAAGADAVLLVANPLESALAIQAMASVVESKRLPIVSHWGITGGDLSEETVANLPKVDLVFLQTFSFLKPNPSERSRTLVGEYCNAFDDADSARDIFAPVGTAHAYELVMMLASAIEVAGTTDREAVRDALESLGSISGLIRDYKKPFSKHHHDALTIDDFNLAQFDQEGSILLVTPIRTGGTHE